MPALSDLILLAAAARQEHDRRLRLLDEAKEDLRLARAAENDAHTTRLQAEALLTQAQNEGPLWEVRLNVKARPHITYIFREVFAETEFAAIGACIKALDPQWKETWVARVARA